MASLRDFFPEDFIKNKAEQDIDSGSVISIFDPQANKVKRHLIIGFDNDRILSKCSSF